MQPKFFLNHVLLVGLLASCLYSPGKTRCFAREEVAEPGNGDRRATLHEWKQRIVTSNGESRRANISSCLRQLQPFELVSLLEKLASDADNTNLVGNERSGSIEALVQILSEMGIVEAGLKPPSLDELRRVSAGFRAGVTSQSGATRNEIDIEQTKTRQAKVMATVREGRHVGEFVSAMQDFFRRWPPLGGSLKDLEVLSQSEWSRTDSTAKLLFSGPRSSATIFVTLDSHDRILSVEYTLGG